MCSFSGALVRSMMRRGYRHDARYLTAGRCRGVYTTRSTARRLQANGQLGKAVRPLRARGRCRFKLDVHSVPATLSRKKVGSSGTVLSRTQREPPPRI